MGTIVLDTPGGQIVLSVQDAAPSRVLLSADDFTLAGHYVLNNNLGTDLRFGGPITHRYIDGELRFLVIEYAVGASNVIEFKLPASGGFGQTLAADRKTNLWAGADIWAKSNGLPDGNYHKGFWWEDTGTGDDGVGLLWASQGMDYPQSPSQIGLSQAISVRQLNGDGSVSNTKGLWGFEGVSQRCVAGRVQKNPQWAREAHGLGERLYLGGGYASLLLAGGVCSLGLFAISGPDVSTYSQLPAYATESVDFNVPATDFTIVSDHRSGTPQIDWYGDGSPAALDRGVRLSSPINFFDDPIDMDPLQPFPDSTYYETHMPGPNANWLSPAPDDKARMTWGDSYYGTPLWIDGPNKFGLVAVASLMGGWAGYVDSHLESAHGEAEVHIFDPADLGSVLAETKNPWNVQPAAMRSITSDLIAQGICTQKGTGSEINTPTGATFDARTKRLWILSLGCDDAHGGATACVLSCYNVNC